MDRAAVNRALEKGKGLGTGIDKKNWHLEKLKHTIQQPGIILPYLERALLKRAVDNASDRDQSFLHASEMAKNDWCERSSWYRIMKFPIEKDDKYSFNLQRIFEEGHDIHNKFQTWAWDAGILEGVWKCLIPWCRHGWYGISPHECPQCGYDLIEYKEVPLYNEKYHIIGHADGIINIDGWRALWEIKSLGARTLQFENPNLYKQYEDGEITLNDMWVRTRTPLPSHRRQGILYSTLTGITKVHYIYEWKPNQQVKEFQTVVRHGDADDLLARALSVAQGLERKLPPTRPQWASPTHNVCNKCPYQNECWTGEADAQDQQQEERPVATLTAGQRTQRIRRRVR